MLYCILQATANGHKLAFATGGGALIEMTAAFIAFIAFIAFSLLRAKMAVSAALRSSQMAQCSSTHLADVVLSFPFSQLPEGSSFGDDLTLRANKGRSAAMPRDGRM